MSIAYLLDILPPFPRPDFPQQSVFEPSNETSTSEKIIGLCSDLKQLQNITRLALNRESRDPRWSSALFRVHKLGPILYRLLVTRVEIDIEDSTTVTLEAFRLAAILYFNRFRAKLGGDTFTREPFYASKLYNLLSYFPLMAQIPSRLFIWILSVACTSVCNLDHRLWFLQLLKKVLVEDNISNFDELFVILYEVVWDEVLSDVQTDALRKIFEKQDGGVWAVVNDSQGLQSQYGMFSRVSSKCETLLSNILDLRYHGEDPAHSGLVQSTWQ